MDRDDGNFNRILIDYNDIDGLVEDCGSSSAPAKQIPLSDTKLSI